MSIERMLFSASGAGSSTPPVPEGAYFENIPLLIKQTSTNGQINNNFLDSGPNNFTISKVGGSGQGAATPFFGQGYYSATFDGTGDTLTIANSAAFGFGTGDFTIECWIYLTAAPVSRYTLIDFRPTNSTVPHTVYIQNSSGNLYLGFYNGTSEITSSSQPILTNNWVHCVWTKESGTRKIFVNGIQAYSAADSVDYQASRPITIGGTISGAEYLSGYVSNLRIVKGTAVYTSNFSVPTTPLTAIANTQLLTLQNDTLADNSVNDFSLTASGNLGIVRLSPFAPPAAYDVSTYSGSVWLPTGSYLTVPSNAALAFGTGNFTIEAWFYRFTRDVTTPIIDNSTGSTDLNYYTLVIDNGNVVRSTLRNSSGIVAIVGTTPVVSNTWNHIALVRVGNNFTIYLNGVADATGTSSLTLTQRVTNIGAFLFTGFEQYFNGFISNLRVVKGTALYTSNFVPSTTPLTAISGTSLLLKFENAGIYDATGNSDIILFGNTQVSSAASKWSPTSFRFDGSGDYLAVSSINDTNIYKIGSSDFTIELWLNLQVVSATEQIIFDFRPSAISGLYPVLYINTSGVLIYSVNATARITASASLLTGQWYHIALTRSGTSTKLFVNGVQTGSTYTDTNEYIVGNSRPYLGASSFQVGTLYLNAYMQDFRFTQGVARYTSDFTPPTTTFPTN